MNKILTILLLSFITLSGMAQRVYSPSTDGVPGRNQPVGISGLTLDGRSRYHDTTISPAKWRDFQSTIEVNSYYNTATKRDGRFPIYIHSGGSLSAGVWTGGTFAEYWYKGPNDTDLVVKNPAIAATACFWPSETTLGTIYSQNNWSVSTDFTTHGALTATASGGYINLANGGTSFADYVTIGGPTNLNKWHMHSLIKVTSLTTGGIGIGLRYANTVNKFDFIGSFGINSGGSSKIYLPIIGNSPVIYDSSSSNFPYSLNDVLEVDVDFNINTATVSVRNATIGSAPVTVIKLWIDPAHGAGMPNTGNFVIYSYGGTQQIQALDITSNTTKNASLLVIGDSKTQGFYADQWNTSYPNILNNTYPTTNFRAGEGDGVQQTLAGMNEILALHPQQVIMNIGSNDYRASRTTSQIISDYNSVVTQLQSAGIKVFHIVMPEDSTSEGGVGMTALKNYIATTYGASYINQVWDTLSTSNVLKSVYQHDVVHVNQAGMNAVAAAIIGSGKITVCADRLGKVISTGTVGYISKFNSSNTIENSGLFQSGNKFGFNTNDPQAFVDVVGHTTTYNTAQFGTLGLQSYGPGNAFISNNSKFNGTGTTFRTSRPTSVFQMYDSSFLFYNTQNGIKDSATQLTLLLKLGRNYTAKDAPHTLGVNIVGIDTIPFLGMSYKTGGTDEKNWDEYIAVKKKYYRILSDDPLNPTNSFTNWMVVSRTGINVDSVNFPNSGVSIKGLIRSYAGITATGLIRSDSGLIINSTSGFPVNINSNGTSSYLTLNHNSGSPNVGVAYRFGGVTKWSTFAYTNVWGLYNNTIGNYAFYVDSLTNNATFIGNITIPTFSTSDSSNKAVTSAWVKRQPYGGAGGGSTDTSHISARIDATFSTITFATDSTGFTLHKANGDSTKITFAGGSSSGGVTAGVTSLNGNTGALTLDTTYITNFSVKVRSLFTAGTGITIINGVISATGGAAAWGSITGTLSSQSDLNTALSGKANTSHTHAESDVTNLVSDLAGKAPLASPTFTGNPTLPNQAYGDNSIKAANTAFVDRAIDSIKAYVDTNKADTITSRGGAAKIVYSASANKLVFRDLMGDGPITISTQGASSPNDTLLKIGWGHTRGTPTFTLSGGGTSPTITVTGNDVWGMIDITTGSSGTLGILNGTLTFASPYSYIPVPHVTPGSASIVGVFGFTSSGSALNIGSNFSLAYNTSYKIYYSIPQ